MQILVRRLTGWAYHNDSFVKRWRGERMRAFLRLVEPPSGALIVDLGGTEHVWNTIDHDFRVTLVNLPGTRISVSDPSRYATVHADACELDGVFADGVFDVAFSNSTIEHVGDEGRQERFAYHVRRIARAYWVQTPSDGFPIEAHTGVPFYWHLPQSMRNRLHGKWQRVLPGWYRMLAEMRVLSLPRMQELFPDGFTYRERLFGSEKSYSMYRPYMSAE